MIRGIAIAAVVLLISGCGGGAETPESAREWLTKQGYKIDRKGLADAIRGEKVEVMKKYVIAERDSPALGFVGNTFVWYLGRCAADDSGFLTSDQCVKATQTFLDAGVPLDLEIRGYTIERGAREMLAIRPSVLGRNVYPEQRAAIEVLVAYIESRKGKQR